MDPGFETPESQLHTLLVTCFSVEELRVFLGNYYPDVLASLPDQISADALAGITIGLLKRRGHLTPILFDRLIEKRPHMRAALLACNAQWAQTSTDSSRIYPSSLAVPPSLHRRPRALQLGLLAALAGLLLLGFGRWAFNRSTTIKVAACAIPCEECKDLQRAWIFLDTGESYTVIIDGNVIRFHCSLEGQRAFVVVEIDDGLPTVRYLSKQLMLAHESAVSLQDFSDTLPPGFLTRINSKPRPPTAHTQQDSRPTPSVLPPAPQEREQPPQGPNDIPSAKNMAEPSTHDPPDPAPAKHATRNPATAFPAEDPAPFLPLTPRPFPLVPQVAIAKSPQVPQPSPTTKASGAKETSLKSLSIALYIGSGQYAWTDDGISVQFGSINWNAEHWMTLNNNVKLCRVDPSNLAMSDLTGEFIIRKSGGRDDLHIIGIQIIANNETIYSKMKLDVLLTRDNPVWRGFIRSQTPPP